MTAVYKININAGSVYMTNQQLNKIVQRLNILQRRYSLLEF